MTDLTPIGYAQVLRAGVALRVKCSRVRSGRLSRMTRRAASDGSHYTKCKGSRAFRCRM